MSNGRLNERAAQGAQAQPSWLGARDEDETKPSTALADRTGFAPALGAQTLCPWHAEAIFPSFS